MLSHRPVPESTEGQRELRGELERAVVRLCRSYPEDQLGAAAHEEVMDLRARVQEAIQILENIREQRRLTEEELSWGHVLRSLLKGGR